jgi:DNA polymerase-3 subunit epsilon
LRKDDFPYSVYYHKDKNGYYTFQISKSNVANNNSKLMASFSSRKVSKSFIDNTIIKYSLCKNISGIKKYDGSCFEYGIGLCFGACINEESPKDYNLRMKVAIEDNLFFTNKTFIITEEGRNEDEASVIFVENNNYKGYAFYDRENTIINNIQDVYNIIDQKEYDKDFNTIIKRHINSGKGNIKILK